MFHNKQKKNLLRNNKLTQRKYSTVERKMKCGEREKMRMKYVGGMIIGNKIDEYV